MAYIWIDETVVLAIHDEQLAEHGGRSGIRDRGLLQSALARPKNLAAYGEDVGIAALSAWVSVPHYAGGPPSPKAALALVTTIEDLFDVQIPRLDLAEQARAWELTVDEMAESEPEMADYVASLEEAADAAELPEASGDALAREFERYLRGRQEG